MANDFAELAFAPNSPGGFIALDFTQCPSESDLVRHLRGNIRDVHGFRTIGQTFRPSSALQEEVRALAIWGGSLVCIQAPRPYRRAHHRFYLQ
jgi:hypothetical protein